MNLNDFVVLPNNKARSVKLNARNLQELKMETVTLTNESKEMEEKLQQLKYSMSKEKEERGHSGRFRWTSGQCGPLNSNSQTNSSKKNKERTLQKLSTGKLKIRVLKDEPLTVPPQPPPPAPTAGLWMTRKSKLKGTICGQCEVKTAGVMCAECTENYCIGCFGRFHQKGALKLHRMIPIKTDLQTHVSTQDVVRCFQKQNNPSSYPSPSTTPNSDPTITAYAITRRGDESPEKGTQAEQKHMEYYSDCSEVLVVSHGEVKTEVIAGEDRKESPSLLLNGDYNEEESAKSFQEALRQWRGERMDGRREAMTAEAMWIPVRPVSMTAMATQADLPPDRGAEGRRRGGGEERLPVKVEFTESSLTYMNRLLLKKHRRTPIEIYQPSLAFGTDLVSVPATNTVEKTTSNLTAEEEDLRRYCASLFTVPVSRGRTEPQITTPESCLVIEVLDEPCRDIKGNCAAEQRTDINREFPSVQEISRKEKTLVPQTAVSSGGLSRVSPSSAGPAQLSRQSGAPKTAQKLHSSETQTSQAQRSVESLPHTSKPTETQRTSMASIKTLASEPPGTIYSPTIHKSKAKCKSPQLLSSLPHSQSEIPKSSPSPLLYSALDGNSSPVPEEHFSPSPSISVSLRSTFTVSPSSSNESTLLPRVYSAPLRKGSDSSSFQEQPQSSQLFAETISSPKLCESPRSNLMSPQQSQHSLCDPEFLLSDNQLLLPLSPVSASPQLPLKTPAPGLVQTTSVPYGVFAKTPSTLSLFNESPPDAYSRYRSTPTYGDGPVSMSSTPISDDLKSTLSHQETHCVPSSHLLNVIQNPALAVESEEEEELSIDSGDEMSSDSLGLAPHEDDSSDEEAQMQGRLTRERSREEQKNPAIAHQEDSFVPAEAETEKDLQTDKPEQLSKPSTVMHNQSAGPGSEQFYDLDGFSPPGFDVNNTVHAGTPEHAHCEANHTIQSSPHDPGPTGSESYGSSSSLSTSTEEHLLFRAMKDNHTQPTGIHTHSTRRREILACEPGTSGSGSNLPGNPTPIVSHPRRTNPSPLSASVSPCLSHSPSPLPLSARLCRPTSGSQFVPAFRPLSRAAQEIMEICGVDQTGCEDPDLDADATAHTLHALERELRLRAEETETLVFGTKNSGNKDERASPRFTRAEVTEEQKEEEEAAKRDRQSVLLLP
ncbi:mucin-17 [Brachyistius frenatus]|uniref:mucin-17 n=1 Tax=Brachyistius frenatus TaxID=100188 RepID=UPI0037E7D954